MNTKLTLAHLLAIRHTLRNVLLPIRGTSLTYIITQNVVKLDLIIEEKTNQIQEIKQKFTFRGANDIPLKYSYIADRKSATHGDIELNEKNEYVVLSDEDAKIKPTSTRVDVSNKEYIDAMAKCEEDVEIEFKKFDSKLIKKHYDEGIFDGIDLTPLIGYLFDLID